MEVETKNASLETMVVTIQALCVSGKQMTLAVFRQLPRRSAYNDDGTLKGDLQYWGLVRYAIKDDGALWLVASNNGRLFRCNVQHSWREVADAKSELAQEQSKLRDVIAYETAEAEVDNYTKCERLASEQCPHTEWEKRYQWLRNKLGPVPTRPDRPRWCRYFEGVPERATVEHMVNRRQEALRIALNAESSKRHLLTLSQLFIAV